MIRFLTMQYRMGKVTEAYLDRLVEIGRITAEQKIEIMEG